MKETRLVVEIPEELMNKFKAACYSDGKSMRDVILQFVPQYINYIQKKISEEK